MLARRAASLVVRCMLLPAQGPTRCCACCAQMDGDGLSRLWAEFMAGLLGGSALPVRVFGTQAGFSTEPQRQKARVDDSKLQT